MRVMILFFIIAIVSIIRTEENLFQLNINNLNKVMIRSLKINSKRSFVLILPKHTVEGKMVFEIQSYYSGLYFEISSEFKELNSGTLPNNDNLLIEFVNPLKSVRINMVITAHVNDYSDNSNLFVNLMIINSDYKLVLEVDEYYRGTFHSQSMIFIPKNPLLNTNFELKSNQHLSIKNGDQKIWAKEISFGNYLIQLPLSDNEPVTILFDTSLVDLPILIEFSFLNFSYDYGKICDIYQENQGSIQRPAGAISVFQSMGVYLVLNAKMPIIDRLLVLIDGVKLDTANSLIDLDKSSKTNFSNVSNKFPWNKRDNEKKGFLVIDDEVPFDNYSVIIQFRVNLEAFTTTLINYEFIFLYDISSFESLSMTPDKPTILIIDNSYEKKQNISISPSHEMTVFGYYCPSKNANLSNLLSKTDYSFQQEIQIGKPFTINISKHSIIYFVLSLKKSPEVSQDTSVRIVHDYNNYFFADDAPSTFEYSFLSEYPTYFVFVKPNKGKFLVVKCPGCQVEKGILTSTKLSEKLYKEPEKFKEINSSVIAIDFISNDQYYVVEVSSKYETLLAVYVCFSYSELLEKDSIYFLRDTTITNQAAVLKQAILLFIPISYKLFMVNGIQIEPQTAHQIILNENEKLNLDCIDQCSVIIIVTDGLDPSACARETTEILYSNSSNFISLGASLLKSDYLRINKAKSQLKYSIVIDPYAIEIPGSGHCRLRKRKTMINQYILLDQSDFLFSFHLYQFEGVEMSQLVLFIDEYSNTANQIKLDIIKRKEEISDSAIACQYIYQEIGPLKLFLDFAYSSASNNFILLFLYNYTDFRSLTLLREDKQKTVDFYSTLVILSKSLSEKLIVTIFSKDRFYKSDSLCFTKYTSGTLKFPLPKINYKVDYIKGEISLSCNEVLQDTTYYYSVFSKQRLSYNTFLTGPVMQEDNITNKLLCSPNSVLPIKESYRYFYIIAQSIEKSLLFICLEISLLTNSEILKDTISIVHFEENVKEIHFKFTPAKYYINLEKAKLNKVNSNSKETEVNMSYYFLDLSTLSEKDAFETTLTILANQNSQNVQIGIYYAIIESNQIGILADFPKFQTISIQRDIKFVKFNFDSILKFELMNTDTQPIYTKAEVYLPNLSRFIYVQPTIPLSGGGYRFYYGGPTILKLGLESFPQSYIIKFESNSYMPTELDDSNIMGITSTIIAVADQNFYFLANVDKISARFESFFVITSKMSSFKFIIADRDKSQANEISLDYWLVEIKKIHETNLYKIYDMNSEKVKDKIGLGLVLDDRNKSSESNMLIIGKMINCRSKDEVAVSVLDDGYNYLIPFDSISCGQVNSYSLKSNSLNKVNIKIGLISNDEANARGKSKPNSFSFSGVLLQVFISNYLVDHLITLTNVTSNPSIVFNNSNEDYYFALVDRDGLTSVQIPFILTSSKKLYVELGVPKSGQYLLYSSQIIEYELISADWFETKRLSQRSVIFTTKVEGELNFRIKKVDDSNSSMTIGQCFFVEIEDNEKLMYSSLNFSAFKVNGTLKISNLNVESDVQLEIINLIQDETVNCVLENLLSNDSKKIQLGSSLKIDSEMVDWNLKCNQNPVYLALNRSLLKNKDIMKTYLKKSRNVDLDVKKQIRTNFYGLISNNSRNGKLHKYIDFNLNSLEDLSLCISFPTIDPITKNWLVQPCSSYNYKVNSDFLSINFDCSEEVNAPFALSVISATDGSIKVTNYYKLLNPNVSPNSLYLVDLYNTNSLTITHQNNKFIYFYFVAEGSIDNLNFVKNNQQLGIKEATGVYVMKNNNESSSENPLKITIESGFELNNTLHLIYFGFDSELNFKALNEFWCDMTYNHSKKGFIELSAINANSQISGIDTSRDQVYIMSMLVDDDIRSIKRHETFSLYYKKSALNKISFEDNLGKLNKSLIFDISKRYLQCFYSDLDSQGDPFQISCRLVGYKYLDQKKLENNSVAIIAVPIVVFLALLLISLFAIRLLSKVIITSELIFENQNKSFFETTLIEQPQSFRFSKLLDWKSEIWEDNCEGCDNKEMLSHISEERESQIDASEESIASINFLKMAFEKEDEEVDIHRNRNSLK